MPGTKPTSNSNELLRKEYTMEHFGRQSAFLIFILSITTLVLAHT
jgi:hypothetical protein